MADSGIAWRLVAVTRGPVRWFPGRDSLPPSARRGMLVRSLPDASYPVNYLAHALLSQPDDAALLGNLAGDHVKGPLGGQPLHPRVAAGVRRHRRVDALTDAQPAYRRALARFPAGQRRFAGVALDIVFDHFLCGHWARFSAVPLAAFRGEVYRVIHAHPHWLPPGFAAFAPAWAEARWLEACETLDGVDAVLARLAARRRRPLPRRPLMATLREEQGVLEAAFLDVFPAVRAALPEAD